VIVLDTDVLTIIQQAAGPEYGRLLARLGAGSVDPFCVTIVSFEEQMRGWMAYIARAGSPERQTFAYARLRGLLEDFGRRAVLDFDDRAAAEFRRLTQLKIRIGTMDRKIASIALVHNATLISRNLADFRKVPGLTVEDWTV
jgi:tRNA(fMet)-specific endonuclease VapC